MYEVESLLIKHISIKSPWNDDAPKFSFLNYFLYTQLQIS